MRIFTNEDAIVNGLARADASQEAVAWRDPLAFGRLAPESDLNAFGTARAELFACLGWDEREVLEGDFRFRNRALTEAVEDGQEIRLLFGGSLRDQLQLSQILHWFSLQPVVALESVRMMVIDGPLSVFEDGALLEIAKEGDSVDDGALEAYRAVWSAVTSDDPRNAEQVFRLLRKSREQLTLASAVERWLQELPSCENGLSITECQILDAVRLEVHFPQDLFEVVEETESAPFRTNWEFWQILAGLTSGPRPLLRVAGGRRFLCPPKDLAWIDFHDQRLELTETGQSILEGKTRYPDVGMPERWLGGTRLIAANPWFWDYQRSTVIRQPEPAIGPTA